MAFLKTLTTVLPVLMIIGGLNASSDQNQSDDRISEEEALRLFAAKMVAQYSTKGSSYCKKLATTELLLDELDKITKKYKNNFSDVLVEIRKMNKDKANEIFSLYKKVFVMANSDNTKKGDKPARIFGDISKDAPNAKEKTKGNMELFPENLFKESVEKKDENRKGVTSTTYLRNACVNGLKPETSHAYVYGHDDHKEGTQKFNISDLDLFRPIGDKSIAGKTIGNLDDDDKKWLFFDTENAKPVKKETWFKKK
jgi:hypothetical protein